MQCNAGTWVTNLVGDLPGYGPVWFDSRAIANVLSSNLVKEKYHIQYNSDKKDGFMVTKQMVRGSSSYNHHLDFTIWIQPIWIQTRLLTQPWWSIQWPKTKRTT